MLDVTPAPERRQWPRPDVGAIGDRDADAPLPEVDAERPRHGDASGSSLGVSSGTGPEVVTSTRDSIVGTVPTQSGQTVSCGLTVGRRGSRVPVRAACP